MGTFLDFIFGLKTLERLIGEIGEFRELPLSRLCVY